MTDATKRLVDAAKALVAGTGIEDWLHNEDCPMQAVPGEGCEDAAEALGCADGCHVCDCYVRHIAGIEHALRAFDAEASAPAPAPATTPAPSLCAGCGLWRRRPDAALCDTCNGGPAHAD